MKIEPEKLHIYATAIVILYKNNRKRVTNVNLTRWDRRDIVLFVHRVCDCLACFGAQAGRRFPSKW